MNGESELALSLSDQLVDELKEKFISADASSRPALFDEIEEALEGQQKGLEYFEYYYHKDGSCGDWVDETKNCIAQLNEMKDYIQNLSGTEGTSDIYWEIYNIDSEEQFISYIDDSSVIKRLALLNELDELIPNANRCYARDEYYANDGHTSWNCVKDAYDHAMFMAKMRTYLALYIEQLTREQLGARIEQASDEELNEALDKLTSMRERESARYDEINRPDGDHRDSESQIEFEQKRNNLEILNELAHLVYTHILQRREVNG